MPTEVKISDASFMQPPQPQHQITNERVAAKNSAALDEYHSIVYGTPRDRPLIKEEDLDINDVLCGRGTKHRNSSGNIMYHTLVQHFIPGKFYFSSHSISIQSIQMIQTQSLIF
jgi:hypothetical protein